MKPEIKTKHGIDMRTAKRVGEIQKELKTILSELDGKYDPKFTASPCPTPGDLTDFLAYLKDEISSRADGRPQPLVIQGEELASCNSADDEYLADIGSVALDRIELVLVLRWIEKVIAWRDSQNGRQGNNLHTEVGCRD